MLNNGVTGDYPFYGGLGVLVRFGTFGAGPAECSSGPFISYHERTDGKPDYLTMISDLNGHILEIPELTKYVCSLRDLFADQNLDQLVGVVNSLGPKPQEIITTHICDLLRRGGYDV